MVKLVDIVEGVELLNQCDTNSVCLRDFAMYSSIYKSFQVFTRKTSLNHLKDIGIRTGIEPIHHVKLPLHSMCAV